MNIKEFIARYRTPLVIACLVLIITLTGVMCYRMGKINVCQASEGTLVTDVNTGREFCLITTEFMKQYCTEIIKKEPVGINGFI